MKTTSFKRMIVRTDEIGAVRDGNMTYSLERKGPSYWKTLRQEDYGRTESGSLVRELVMPGATRLAYHGVQNKIDVVTEAVKKGLTGNTLVLYAPSEIFGIDNPDERLVAQLGVNSQEVLKELASELNTKLGGREESGVVYSNNGAIRRTKREGIVTEVLTPLKLSTNRMNILISGGLENADLVSQIADNDEHFNSNPKVWASSDPYGVRVVGLFSDRSIYVDGDRLNVGGDDWDDDNGWRAFGGFDSAEGSAQKGK